MSPRSGAGGRPAGSCFTSRALQVTTNHRLPRHHVHLSSDRDLDNIHSTLFVFLNVFMSAGRPQAAFLGIVLPLHRSDPVTGNTVTVTTRVLEWVWGFSLHHRHTFHIPRPVSSAGATMCVVVARCPLCPILGTPLSWCPTPAQHRRVCAVAAGGYSRHVREV